MKAKRVKMKRYTARFITICAITGVLCSVFAMRGVAQQTAPSHASSAPLKLLQTIPLAGVDGALDHMAIDVRGQRLFVPSEQHGTVEVLDLKSGKRIRTISDARWPSTVVYHPPSNQIFVSDRADGTCKVFSGETYELVKSIKLAVGADNAAYDAAGHSLYIATAGRHAGLPYTLIAIVDALTSQHVGDIKVESPNVQAMAFEASGPKMYADMADLHKVAVIDREKRTVLAMWPTAPECQRPYGMALDSAHRRLFVGCRQYATQADWWQPGKMLVMDADSGKAIAIFDAGGGTDEMFFDPASQRIYSQGYEGIADLWKEIDPDHYESIGRIQGGVHGKTSLLVPELKRYYVAVSEHQDVIRGIQGGKIEEAYIEVYAVEP
jgi:DNA-binding beta-propeller fold protein YncE